jgi:hypothetical protein
MAAVSDADYKPCPHCGRKVYKRVRGVHVTRCPLRPEIAAALRAALTGADGCAVSGDEYAARAAGTDLPGMTALIKHFGTLRAAAAHFGLRARDAAGATCPHCGRGYTNLKTHLRSCPQRPEIAAALREALTSDEDGCLASRDEYDALRTPDLPHGNLLSAHFRGWANVAAHFGLPRRSREATNRRRGAGIRRGWAMRREGGSGATQADPLLVGAVRVRTDYGDGDGLIAYGARPLPGGGTVYMLR